MEWNMTVFSLKKPAFNDNRAVDEAQSSSTAEEVFVLAESNRGLNK